ncbi:MAG: hypothetical protein P0S94_02230 [Simkaniaceae bacterium]|nr:hypothetical protein [Simkaniaceae bacterium]
MNRIELFCTIFSETSNQEVRIMCEFCWDIDDSPRILKEHPECIGVNKTPFISMDELKMQIFYKWMSKGRKNFRIRKDAIINPPNGIYRWSAKHYESGKSEQLSLEFI